jgi:hypothetical protein
MTIETFPKLCMIAPPAMNGARTRRNQLSDVSPNQTMIALTAQVANAHAERVEI